MPPKRKDGVCLGSCPALAGADPVCAPQGAGLARQSACSFTTFRGLGQPATGQPDGRVADGKAGGIFQVVPLDEPTQANGAKLIIEPIDFKSGPIAPDEPGPDEPREPFKFAGFLGAVCCSMTCSVGVLAFKLLPVEDTLVEKAKASMFRGAIMTVLCAAAIWRSGDTFRVAKGEYLLNFGRSFLGATNIFLIYASMLYITMGENGALVFSSPIWTCILSSLLLKEPFPLTMVVALPASLLGIVLLSHPDLVIDTSGEVPVDLVPGSNSTRSDLALLHESVLPAMVSAEYDHLLVNETVADAPGGDLEELTSELYFQARLPGIILALIASVCISVIIIILKFRKKTSIDLCTFYLGVAMVVESVLVQCVIGFGALPSTPLEWFLHLVIGTCSYLTQVAFQWSLQFIPASTFSITRNLDIVVGYAMGTVFLGEVLLWTSIVGSVLIMLVVVVVILNEQIEAALQRWCGCGAGSGASESR